MAFLVVFIWFIVTFDALSSQSYDCCCLTCGACRWVPNTLCGKHIITNCSSHLADNKKKSTAICVSYVQLIKTLLVYLFYIKPIRMECFCMCWGVFEMHLFAFLYTVRFGYLFIFRFLIKCNKRERGTQSNAHTKLNAFAHRMAHNGRIWTFMVHFYWSVG